MTSSFEQLDQSSQSDIFAFERAFYDSFSRAKSNRLVRKLWIWNDDECRLKSKVPYTDQIIFISRTNDGSIDTGLAFNNLANQSQAEFFGFTSAESIDRSLEIITFFSKNDFNILELKQFLWQCLEYCQNNNVSYVYATCTARLLKPYKHFGAELLSSATVEGEVRHYIRIDVAQRITGPAL
jgi:hypothetical protein